MKKDFALRKHSLIFWHFSREKIILIFLASIFIAVSLMCVGFTALASSVPSITLGNDKKSITINLDHYKFPLINGDSIDVTWYTGARSSDGQGGTALGYMFFSNIYSQGIAAFLYCVIVSTVLVNSIILKEANNKTMTIWLTSSNSRKNVIVQKYLFLLFAILIVFLPVYFIDLMVFVSAHDQTMKSDYILRLVSNIFSSLLFEVAIMSILFFLAIFIQNAKLYNCIIAIIMAYELTIKVISFLGSIIPAMSDFASNYLKFFSIQWLLSENSLTTTGEKSITSTIYTSPTDNEQKVVEKFTFYTIVKYSVLNYSLKTIASGAIIGGCLYGNIYFFNKKDLD